MVKSLEPPVVEVDEAVLLGADAEDVEEKLLEVKEVGEHPRRESNCGPPSNLKISANLGSDKSFVNSQSFGVAATTKPGGFSRPPFSRIGRIPCIEKTEKG